MSKEVTKTMIKLLKKPKIKFIFKGKLSYGNRLIDKLNKKSYQINIKLHKGGTAENLINESDLIIGFNTSAVMEAMIAKKYVLIPFYKKYRKCLTHIMSINIIKKYLLIII